MPPKNEDHDNHVHTDTTSLPFGYGEKFEKVEGHDEDGEKVSGVGRTSERAHDAYEKKGGT